MTTRNSIVIIATKYEQRDTCFPLIDLTVLKTLSWRQLRDRNSFRLKNIGKIQLKKGEEIIRVSIEKIKYRIEINRKYSIVTMLQISNELESSSYATLSRDLVKTIPRFSYVYLDYYF